MIFEQVEVIFSIRRVFPSLFFTIKYNRRILTLDKNLFANILFSSVQVSLHQIYLSLFFSLLVLIFKPKKNQDVPIVKK